MNLDDTNKIISQGMPEPTPMQQAEYYRLYDRIAAAMSLSPSTGYKPNSRLIHAEVVRRMNIKETPCTP